MLVGAAVVIAVGTIAVGTVSALHKDVSVVVDGHTQQVKTFASTVDGALAAAGLSVGAHDVLAPAGNADISDGSKIVIQRGRPLTLTIDGVSKQVWTTAPTLDQALTQLGLTSAEQSASLQLAANRARTIPLNGLNVRATTFRPVLLSVGGRPAQQVRTDAKTVGELLTDRGISLGASDRVSPATSAPLATGQTIRVDRVTIKQQRVTVRIAQPAASSVNAADLDRGITKVVQQGSAGSQLVTYRITTVNGVQTGRAEIGRTTLKAAKPTIKHVGTRTPAPASRTPTGDAANKFTYQGDEVFTHDTTFGVNWDGLAMCESTHNPKAVNGNPSAGLPTYGLFQFDIPTWASVGGSGNPMDAPPEEQLMRAKLLYQQRGLEPWACAYAAQ